MFTIPHKVIKSFNKDVKITNATLWNSHVIIVIFFNSSWLVSLFYSDECGSTVNTFIIIVVTVYWYLITILWNNHSRKLFEHNTTVSDAAWHVAPSCCSRQHLPVVAANNQLTKNVRNIFRTERTVLKFVSVDESCITAW